MKNLRIPVILALMVSTAHLNAQFQGPGIGFLEVLSDIGSPGLPGTAAYAEPSQEYTLSGSGENIWFRTDQFSFLSKRMSGDFILQGRLSWIGEGEDPHRKAGIMFRKGLTSDAPHISCVVHGDGLTSLQYRESPGDETREIRFQLTAADVLQLEKKGDYYTMSVARSGDLYTTRGIQLSLGNELHAGLFICSHKDGVVEKARFTNVRLLGTAPDDLEPYAGYIGSLLEVMEVETGHRVILDGSPGSWQAPNWTPDGSKLIYNSDGLLYNYDLLKRSSGVLPTGFADRNNNDHVISFDGTRLAISHHPEEDDGQSVVYTLPLEGGTPERVTPNSPSYLHGWSADDRFLVYTGRRNGVYNIFRIPVEGGEEVQLTDEECLDDGPEYSPDGNYIYFNSCRTGTMQLWRMDPDGGNQTQLTFDEYHDWFPHISPDNRWIVFISYPPEVAADAHPFYKRVFLRIMSVEEMKPRVIGYLYGGQGSMNVPSWSPDSRKIAFVSNGIFH